MRFSIGNENKQQLSGTYYEFLIKKKNRSFIKVSSKFAKYSIVKYIAHFFQMLWITEILGLFMCHQAVTYVIEIRILYLWFKWTKKYIIFNNICNSYTKVQRNKYTEH